MRIPVLIEPGYRHSLWARQTLNGMTREAARKKYEFLLLDALHYEQLDWKKLFGASRRLVVLIGTSLSWMPAVQAFLAEQQVGCVLVSINPSQTEGAEGTVSMDHSEATRMLLRYLESCGKQRVAFFALNPNSAADRTKHEAFTAWRSHASSLAEPNVFWNHGSLQECCRVFLSHHSHFDAVICANDIAAAALLPRLRQAGVQVPQQLYLASYGNSALAQALCPPVTSATLSHDALGRRAVHLYAFLLRQSESTASVSIQVRCKIVVRQSTANHPFSQTIAYPVCRPENVDFYSDSEAAELLALETLLEQCDPTDLALFQGLLRGEKQNRLQETLFLSTSALRHRQKNLMTWAGCSDHAAWHAFLLRCQALSLSSSETEKAESP